MSTPPPESTDQTLTDEDDPSESDSLPPSPRRTPPPPPPGWARRRTGAPPAALQIATAKLLTYATTGRLDDAHKTLCQYMASHTTPNPTTGLLELPQFHQSITAAIDNDHPALLSYLFYMRIGKPTFYIYDAVKAKSTAAIFQIFVDHHWNINELLPGAKAPALAYITHDKELTKWFLDNGANPNVLFGWGLTPMSAAMSRASFDTINILFAHGADIRQGQLLHTAVLGNRPESEVIELLNLLLDKGASIDEIQYRNHEQAFQQLQDFPLGTPLHYASRGGKQMVVSYLLARGADRLIKNTKGVTAIEVAKDSEVVKILSQ